MTEPEFESRQSGPRATLSVFIAALANGVWKARVISTGPFESALSLPGIWNQIEHIQGGIKIECWRLEAFSKRLLMGSKRVRYSILTERGLRFDRQSSSILLSETLSQHCITWSTAIGGQCWMTAQVKQACPYLEFSVKDGRRKGPWWVAPTYAVPGHRLDR